MGKNWQVNVMKIVGNIVFVVYSLLFFAIGHAGINMRVMSMDGMPIKQAGVGEPFLLEVYVDNVGRSSQQPNIQGLDSFIVHNNGIYMSTVNSRSTIRYKYKVRSDKQGLYTLGPASIDVNGNTITSNRITLSIGDQQVVDAKRAQKKNPLNKALLRLVADKNHVVVGEKITCALRFYYCDDTVSLGAIREADNAGFSAGQKIGPLSGTQEIDGINYNYAEWRWELYPAELGDKVIPAYSADFVLRSDKDDFFGGFSLFFKTRSEHKRIYSNALTVQVDPLPNYQGTVHAIGDFKQFTATVKPAVAKEGEGMVLTLELEGNGNLHTMQSPKLQDIPQSFQVYDSKSYITQADNNTAMPKKSFEFIIQGMKQGVWEIPKQSFTYFDVSRRRYKTLETSPVMVTIMPRPDNNTYASAEHQSADAAEKYDDNDDVLLPINTHGAWVAVSHREIPWLWFWALCLIPFGIWLVSCIKDIWHRNNNRLSVKKKRAFRVARKKIKEAERTKRYDLLYAIFIELFAARTLTAVGQVSQSFIEDILYSANVSSDVIDTWNGFFTAITEVSFFNKKYNIVSYQDLVQQAQQWIDLLEKKL